MEIEADAAAAAAAAACALFDRVCRNDCRLFWNLLVLNDGTRNGKRQ